MRKTKIICTIGPASNNEEVLRGLMKAGMNIARFNFSHGSHQSHKEAMDRVKRVSEKLNVPVALLLDTKGPEIRTGNVEGDGLITFNSGDKVEITVDGSVCKKDNDKIHLSLSWKELPIKAKKGIKILIADGLIELFTALNT